MRFKGRQLGSTPRAWNLVTKSATDSSRPNPNPNPRHDPNPNPNPNPKPQWVLQTSPRLGGEAMAGVVQRSCRCLRLAVKVAGIEMCRRDAEDAAKGLPKARLPNPDPNPKSLILITKRLWEGGVVHQPI